VKVNEPRLKSMKKRLVVYVIVTLCVVNAGLFQQATGEVSMETKVTLEKGTICVSYSSDEDVLRISYSTDDKECQLTLFSPQRMGLLMQVAGSEITYSLSFLEEEETWPTADILEEEQYSSKTIFETPGWVVIIVQKAE